MAKSIRKGKKIRKAGKDESQKINATDSAKKMSLTPKGDLNFKDTSEIAISEKLIGQVIGC